MKRTPMKRTAFARKPAKAAKPVKLKVVTQHTIRRSRPKTSPIRQAARMQECTLRYPVCNFDPATTVLCHSNRLEDGKGMGIKAPDSAAAFGCSRCHDLLDGRMPIPSGMTYEDVQLGFDRGREKTHVILKKLNLL